MKVELKGYVARDRDNGLLFSDTKPFISQWVDTDSKIWMNISPMLGKKIDIDLKFGDEPRKVLITIETIELDS